MERWIIHIDMDAFFAAVEQRDNEELKGKPVIVGGMGNRGVVATASYEARRFGVHSAMSMVEARRRCREGVFLPCDHEKYSRVSVHLNRIFSEFSPLVEPLSLDEAFLDVSGMDQLYDSPKAIAQCIKERIKSELGLTASAGVAPNKFLAKLASDLQKPDGLVVVAPGEEKAMLHDLPITRMWGVGEATAQILKNLGIYTIGQLGKTDVVQLAKHCGQMAYTIHNLANGQDDRPVIPELEPKTIGNELTFPVDLRQIGQIETELLALAEKVGWRLRQHGYKGRTITVKLRFASFKTITRSKTLSEPTHFDETLYETAIHICRQIPLQEGVRLLGITVSNLQAGDSQLSLFDEQDHKRTAVYEALDKLKNKFGEGIVTKGRLISFTKK
ncbi:DNA polymerase IV [Pelosinus sp. UFO1]|uniref:DNA polymerase IV n=1 Tax=Pelosinus sp. UFO1 TaxID=484770 RepID=UPI0004D125A5|nr:DNA polymerase IV [Pelosinus sp. UFO1]AIF54274.1 DNA polymerase IV [Pelosinus sp. UFO1]